MRLVLLCLLPSWAILLATGLELSAQQSDGYRPNQYRPVYSAPVYSGGGGYWGGGYGYGGGTAASANMRGLASVISAAGQANLANSAAANNWESAYSMDLNNRLQATNTYFEQRRIHRDAMAEERGPRPTEAELTRFAKEAAPSRLTASQLDPVTGEIAWPVSLQDARYDAARQKIDQMFSTRASNSGAVGAAGFRSIRDAIEVLRGEFARNISDYAPQVYIEGRKFLDSLDYEARFAG